MKQLFLLSLSTLALSLAAGATPVTINCTAFPLNFDHAVGTGSVHCNGPGAQAPGTTLASVTVNFLGDYQFGALTGTNIIKLTFAPTGPAGATFNLSSTDILVTGGGSSGPVAMGSAVANSGVTLANFQPGFNVNITSSVIQGSAATSSGGVKVTYDLVSGVPEPSAFALIGIGLVGLGVLRRRF